MKESCWVSQSQLPSLAKQAAKLSQRSDLLGHNTFSFTVTPDTKLNSQASQHPWAVKGEPMVRVEYEINTPTFQDWRIIAELSHKRGELGYHNSVLPIGITSSAFKRLDTKHMKPNCDHCKQHRKRKTTYLLENVKTGNIVQIGSTCLDEFIGLSLLKTMKLLTKTTSAFRTQNTYTIQEDSYVYVDLDHAIRQIMSFIKTYGYYNAQNAEADNNPTKRSISAALYEHFMFQLEGGYADLKDHEELARHMKVVEENSMTVDIRKIKSSLLSSLSQQDNQFSVQLFSFIADEYIVLSVKSLSLLAGAINSHMKESKNSNNGGFKEEHFGNIKDRCQIALTPYLITTNPDGYFGPSTSFYMKDKEGRRFKWVTNSNPDFLEVEKEVMISCTIKGHTSNRILITTIKNCKEVRA